MADNEEKLNVDQDVPENDDAENTELDTAEPTDGDYTGAGEMSFTDETDSAEGELIPEDMEIIDADVPETEDEGEESDGESENDAQDGGENVHTDEEVARRRKRIVGAGGKKGKKGKVVKILVSILLIIAVLLGIVGITAIIDSNRLEKTFYQVKSNKVTSNIRIVCLSDMHLKEFGKDNEYLVHEVDKLSPDIIALVGDMNMEDQPDNYGAVLNLCLKLNEIAPVYYSLGNHEIDAMLFKGSNIYKDVKKAGIKIMNNETETVTIGGTDIDIIGLTQNPTEFERYGKAFFDKAMSATDNFKLVLNHYPEQFFGTLDDYNIDLALAGHAHGRQVRLPWIGGLYSADQGFFPKLCDGYHEIGNSRLLITRGLGKSGLVPRIFNKPEIMVVDIGWY